jgi:FkbM family methyltransferase
MKQRDIISANKKAQAFRDEWRDKVANGHANPAEWQVLKHQWGYYGFQDCSLQGAEFLLFTANDDQVAWELFWTGSYETQVTAEWKRMVSGADIILDVGAYTGCMALMACALNPKCEVFCFEPMPRTIERLKINVLANRFAERIQLMPYAASDSEGMAEMNMPRPADFLGSGNSIKPKENVPIIDTTLVSMVRVENRVEIPHGRKLSCIKLDVEGHELEALEGMVSMIETHRPEMIVEVWHHEKQNVFNFFDHHQYVATQLRGLNWLFTPA